MNETLKITDWDNLPNLDKFVSELVKSNELKDRNQRFYLSFFKSKCLSTSDGLEFLRKSLELKVKDDVDFDDIYNASRFERFITLKNPYFHFYGVPLSDWLMKWHQKDEYERSHGMSKTKYHEHDSTYYADTWLTMTFGRTWLKTRDLTLLNELFFNEFFKRVADVVSKLPGYFTYDHDKKLQWIGYEQELVHSDISIENYKGKYAVVIRTSENYGRTDWQTHRSCECVDHQNCKALIIRGKAYDITNGNYIGSLEEIHPIYDFVYHYHGNFSDT